MRSINAAQRMLLARGAVVVLCILASTGCRGSGAPDGHVASDLSMEAVITAKRFAATHTKQGCSGAGNWVVRDLAKCILTPEDRRFLNAPVSRQPDCAAHLEPPYVRGGWIGRYGWKTVDGADCVAFRGGGEQLFLWLSGGRHQRVVAYVVCYTDCHSFRSPG